MWLKRKPKNRRLGREHVLDVKLRSSQVRAARTRMAVMALGAVFGTVFGLYLLWRGGEWALDRWVYENPAFAIQHIEVQTDGVLPVEQLRRWTNVRTGQNLLALDLARVKRDLELAPLVQSASIERILPHTLRIRVTEREPLAQITVPRPGGRNGIELASLQIDSEGFVIQPMEQPRRPAATGSSDALPLILGINPDEAQPGRRIDTPQVQAGLRLISAFEGSSMAGVVDLKSINVSGAETLVVTTGQGSEITFGLCGLEEQLNRWHTIYGAGQKAGKAIATLDLAVTNNIPARWLEASALPAVTPRPPKPLHNKKKHV